MGSPCQAFPGHGEPPDTAPTWWPFLPLAAPSPCAHRPLGLCHGRCGQEQGGCHGHQQACSLPLGSRPRRPAEIYGRQPVWGRGGEVWGDSGARQARARLGFRRSHTPLMTSTTTRGSQPSDGGARGGASREPLCTGARQGPGTRRGGVGGRGRAGSRLSEAIVREGR